MNRHFIVTAGLWCALASAWAQTPPGAPEENGLTPKTETIYINRQTFDIVNVNNGNTESLGVAIANGGNVIVGWEDDGEGVTDLEAVWTMFDSAGVSITPDTECKSVAPDTAGTITTKFLSYFRTDGSAVGGGFTWGPKIKANPFGDGVGMGSTTWQFDLEDPKFAAYDGNAQGDYPTVQLLDNTGKPLGVVVGLSEEYAVRDSGSVRIGDWDYLSNGNIVVVGESRQNDDLVNVFGGSTPFRHVIFRIVDPTGKVVKAETLASESAEHTGNAEMWHGAGSVQNGFAIRFKSDSGPVVVRMFDNAGNPTSTNINLAEITGYPEAGGGGRGDGAGFHGNGVDAYVAVCSSGSGVWLTVLNANGSVRYSKSAINDIQVSSVDRTDAAIDAQGNVLVVFSAKYDEANSGRIIMGRRFDATGKPVGATFYISEKELPDPNTPAAGGPRVAWRAGQAAVVWESQSDLESLDPSSGEVLTVVAMRLFSTFTPGSIESAGLKRLVADTPVVKTEVNALGNWEPYASVLGNSVFLVEGNTFAENSIDLQRYVVALQPVAGGLMKLGEGFYTDAGQPFKDQINYSRQNGNPGRVAGDTRPGAVNFMVGGEASPHVVPEFQSGNRWELGFDRLADGRYGTVQTFKLDPATLAQTPLSKAQDSAYGRATSGFPAGNQITRFGGDIVCLDNGNFVSVVQDNSRVIEPDGDAVVATIFAPDGSVVKEAFKVVMSDIWSGVAAFRGGFAIRAKPQPAEDGTQAATRVIYFYDNAGNLKGTVDQATSGASFDTGRGDGTRIFGHINSPYVFLAGRAANTVIVKVAAFDSRDQKFVAIADVNEGSFTGNFDRANGAADALDRVAVSWVSQPAGYAKQQVAARVLAFDGAAKKFTTLTPSFFPFVNTATNDIRSLQMSVAMTTRQILIAAKGEINYSNKPELGPDSPTEVNFYTVFTHPAPADDPTVPVGGGGSAAAQIVTTSVSGGNLTITWTGGTAPFAVQMRNNVASGTWTEVRTTNDRSATVPMQSQAAFYRIVGQ